MKGPLQHRKSLKAIIFDLDGVFVDSTKGWIIALQEILRREKYEIPAPSIIEKIVAFSTEGQLLCLFPSLEFNAREKDRLTKLIDNYFVDKITLNVSLFPNVHRVLILLKKYGFRLAVVTNNKSYVASKILATFNLTDYFECLTGLEEMIEPKPHPSGLEITLKKLNLSKDDVIYIGDSPSDLYASLRSYIPFILIKRENAKFDFPDIDEIYVQVITKLEELIIEP
ncbi:MAG: HAD family hydrolase [Candidatus Heimdallarchaeota archaeon]|nr:HAD family hydrolase [Candidatus Heimdallarchaeota archaeon]